MIDASRAPERIATLFRLALRQSPAAYRTTARYTDGALNENTRNGKCIK